MSSKGLSSRIDEMKRLYVTERKTLKQVAEIIGCSDKSIERHLKNNGIKLRTRSEAQKGHKVSDKVREVARELGKRQVGPNNPMWKGKVNRSNGYIGIRKPDHPFASKDGYVMQHRLVVEAALGRYLTKDEDVHHINGIKTDNRLENLEVLHKSEHARFHGLQRVNEGTHNNYIPLDVDTIKECVKQGGTVREIAGRLGIEKSTFYKKLKQTNLKDWYENWRNAQ
jgi:hypothetical protein